VSHVLTVTTEGFGKVTPIEQYPKQQRAGSGVRTIKLVDKTGELADAKVIHLNDQLMFVTANGQVTRTSAKEISVLGRSTQGVILMRLDEGDHVVGVTFMDANAGEGPG